MNMFLNFKLKGFYRTFNIFFVFCFFSAVIFFAVSAWIFQYYKSTAKIMVVNSTKGGSSGDKDTISERTINTISAAIKSRYFMEEIANQLHLNQVFGRESAVNKLESMITIKPVKNTNIIDITVSSHKPELATQVANTAAKLVISDFAKRQFSFEKDMVQWLAEQSAELRMEIEDAAFQLREFNKNLEAYDIKLEYDSIKSQIKNLQVKLSGINAELKKYEAEYDNVKSQLDAGTAPQDLTQVQTDDSYKEIKSEYFVVQNEIKTLLEKYNPDHPEIIKRQEKLNAAERLMSARAQSIIDDVLSNKHFLELKVKEIESLITGHENTLSGLEKDLDQYTALLNKLKEKELLYGALIGKIDKEFNSTGLSIWQVELLDQAYLPVGKEKPSLKVIIFLAIVAGAFLTILYHLLRGNKSVSVGGASKYLKNRQNKNMYIEKIKEDSQ
jgi:uncharacterized protein involved in exopolysaccharide biosynthesis